MLRGVRRPVYAVLVAITLVMTIAPTGATAQTGGERDARIIGGKESPEGAWPSQVGLLDHDRTDNYNAQFCGGTVLSKSWILTAAHCVDRGFEEGRVTPAEVDVLTGTQDLELGGTRIRAVEIRYFKGWNSFSLENDIALIRLDRPTTAPPMPIVAQSTGIAPNTPMTTTGWGNQEAQGSSFPTKLQEVSLPYVADSKCAQIYDDLNAVYRAGIFCAGFIGSSDRDSCNGDSGGPISIKQGGTWVQAGIVSWGVGCADPDFPGIYTRVAKYSDWIKGQIRYGAQPDAASFIRQQYRDFFGRSPSDPELFLGGLETRSMALSDYVAGIVSGANWQRSAGGVARLYQAYFGRDADVDGLKFWIDRVERGSLNPVSSSFAASSEFKTKYGSLSNRDFVELVYDQVLGRPSDTGGINFWTAQLDSAARSRGQVMTGFSESSEFKRKTRARTDVTTTYYALMRRSPTAEEYTAWVGKPNVDLVRTLLGSFDYANRF